MFDNRIGFTKAIKVIAGSCPLAAFAIGMVAAPAQGHGNQPLEIDGAAGQVTREVTYADLDLATKAADRMLARRVGAAVNSVCNEAVGPDESSQLLCASQAWGLAWPQVVRAERRAREIARTGAASAAGTSVTVKAI